LAHGEEARGTVGVSRNKKRKGNGFLQKKKKLGKGVKKKMQKKLRPSVWANPSPRTKKGVKPKKGARCLLRTRKRMRREHKPARVTVPYIKSEKGKIVPEDGKKLTATCG